jgi:hypothetical protein
MPPIRKKKKKNGAGCFIKTAAANRPIMRLEPFLRHRIVFKAVKTPKQLSGQKLPMRAGP